jgi:hypothetical protein
MLVAREKRKKNIAEYVLYMWQIEDTLRAFKFDINLIEERLLVQFKQSESVLDEIRGWYSNLILAMHEEGITKSGHLQFVKGVTDEMNQLHLRLLNEIKDEEYIKNYNAAKDNIDAFKVKLQKPEANEIELCFYALYGLLLLRLKKKEISEETKNAMTTFSNLLAALSNHYRLIEEGKSEF